MNEPALRGSEPFSVRHDRFLNALKPTDWDELTDESTAENDGQKIQFVYGRLYASSCRRHGACSGGDNSNSNDEYDADESAAAAATTSCCKDGEKALEMKKSGTECFQRSDYRNALNWYSLAVLHCPQTTKGKIYIYFNYLYIYIGN